MSQVDRAAESRHPSILLLFNAMMFSIIAFTNYRRGEVLVAVVCWAIAVLSLVVYASMVSKALRFDRGPGRSS